jgi:N-acetyl-gamma-glutamyl-phosphate reductase
MQEALVGVVGASGYSGMEVTRLVVGHPALRLAFAASDRWQGETLGERQGVVGPAATLRYAPLSLSEELAGPCQAVLLATPPSVSLSLAPPLRARGIQVIDLSGAFRLRDVALYPPHYGFEHSAQALLAEAKYGLPELQRHSLAGAGLVANPGCYATAVALPLAPLLRADLIEPDSLIADAASGVTGAGRKTREDLGFAEVAEDFRAYRVLRHPHTPEMEQTLTAYGGRPVTLTFTPHLLPLRRGILATIYARLKPGIHPTAALETLTVAYRDEPFVAVRPSPEDVSLRRVNGTNRCELSITGDGRGQLVMTSALDNLLKGAAGQALQNLNLALGLGETLGLEGLLAVRA